jgi:hypothetical protein
MAIDGDILEFEAVFPFQQTLELPPEICQDLPSRFHVDVHAAVQRSAADVGSSCDWMLSACTESSNRSLAMIPRRIKVLVN